MQFSLIIRGMEQLKIPITHIIGMHFLYFLAIDSLSDNIFK